jgi:cytochrome c peroxidase
LRYDQGRLDLFVDGDLDGSSQGNGGPLPADAGILIGPGDGGEDNGLQPVLIIDEVLVSRVARTDDEIRRSAFRPVEGPDFLDLEPGDVDLPVGLDARDLKIPVDNVPTVASVALGQALFSDPRLSGDGTVSCATCHEPDLAFTDGLALGVGISGVELPRNTPTTINRAFSTAQFLDGRAASLEEQALGPIEHPDEMGADLDTVLQFLASDPQYSFAFQAVYGEAPSRDSLAKALATFQRLILRGNSRVDQFEAGNIFALTPLEQLGRATFRGKGRCTACHTGSNYSDEEFHNTAATPTEDLGRLVVTGRTRDTGAFKTPTVRDIGLTGPYFHNGSAATLADVVEAYDTGGVGEAGRDPEIRPLGLTQLEKDALVAFMEALASQ